MSKTISGVHERPRQYIRSNYPFVDGATLTDRSGKVLDKAAILDARIYGENVSEQTYISRIVSRFGQITVYISDPSVGELGSGSYSSATDLIAITDQYDREIGVLYCDATAISATAAGEMMFSASATQFVPSVLVPYSGYDVTGILDGDQNLLTGDVWLVGENGVVIKNDGNNIKIHIVGDSYYIRRLCEDELGVYTTRRPLKSFIVKSRYGKEGESTNHGEVIPDQAGGVLLVAGDGSLPPAGTAAEDNIIRIYPMENGLLLDMLGTFE